MNQLKKYSISKRLTLSLIFTVGIVATLTISIMFINASRLALRELEKDADKTIAYLSGALKIPLWQMNKDTVNLIGKTVFQSEIIVKLQISDDSGRIIYSEEKVPDDEPVNRISKIYYNNNYLGEVEIHATKKYFRKSSRKQLISYCVITLFVLTSLFLATGMFIRKFLKKPLTGLNAIVKSYKAGVYDSDDHQLPYLEFEPFRNVLAQMGETINAQMKDLKRAEEKYRSIFDNAVEGIFQTTMDGRFLSANPSAARIFGYDSPNDMINSTTDIRSQLYVNPSQRDERYQFEQSDIVTGFEVELYRKDKSKIWVSANTRAVRGADGEILFLEGFLEDITERKRSEEAIRISEKKYRHIFDNVTDFLFVHDLKGHLFETNLSFRKEYGVAADEPIRMNLRDMMPAAEKVQFDDYLKTIQDQGHHEGRISIVTKDGRQLTIEYKNALVFDSDDAPVAVLGSGRDITHRMQAEKDKRKLESRLQQAQRMEALGTLAGGIAHDFNNLLMGIQGRTSLMLLAVDAHHPVVEHLTSIESYVQSASDLTKQLLGLARGGKYEIKPTDINHLIEKSVCMFGRTKKEIRIYKKLHDRLWTVEVDQGQMDQVLLNIFVNAGQAMPTGGDLTVETQNVTIQKEDARLYDVRPGNYIKISITDTGIGIEKDTLKRIFDPFFSTKGIGRGTGLGLASAYGIIKNHDGTINVFSKVGEGSTFDLYLPATDKESELPGNPSKLMYGNKQCIFLIDDEEIVLDVGAQLLEMLNYNVIRGKSGPEAIEIFKSDHQNIDLVVLDMIMPGMSGGQVFEQLKAINPDVVVLLSSGYSINGQASALLEKGCRGFIQKPFNIEEFSIKLRELLEKGAIPSLV
jgi:two-component system cell cycle sensor histidine kinase/response regulator CckA